MNKRSRQIKKYKIENLFLMLTVVFGLLTAVIQPIFSPPDEYTHFNHAYYIFHDNSNPINERDTLMAAQDGGGVLAEDGSAVNIPTSFIYQIPYQKGDFFQKYFVDEVSAQYSRKLDINLGFKDIKWLPQSIGVLIGSFIHPSYGIMILLGRLVNLAIYVLALYFAIKKAKLGQHVMAAVALLPISIQQASSLSYDVLYYTAIFLTFSLLTHLWTRNKKLDMRWLIYILLVVILLFIPKTSTLALGLFFITLPTVLFGNNKFSKALDAFWSFCSKHKWLTALVVIVFFLAYLVYEFRNYGGALRGIQVLINTFFRPDLYSNLDNVLVSGMVGNFGQMTYRLPEWLVVIDFILLFILALREKSERLETRIAVSGGIIYFAVLVMTAVGMLTGWTTNTLNLPHALVSLGNQGRYYTPFLIVFIPVGIAIQKYIKITAKDTTIKAVFNTIIIFNLVYFVVVTILYYYTKDMGANLLPSLSQWIRGLL